MINKLIILVLILVLIPFGCESYPEFIYNHNDKGSGGSFSGDGDGDIQLGGAGYGASANGGSNTGGSVCVSVDVTFEKQHPTVVLLIDRSGSMEETDFSPTRWLAVRSALFDSTGVVTTLESDVQFGLALYNSNNGNFGGVCPIMKTTVPDFNAGTITTAEFDEWDPQADTPTGDSIDWIVSSYDFGDVQGPRIIVLATDGEPDTCEVPNPNDPVGNPAGRTESITAVTNAYTAGIETYVISVGADVAVQHLQDLANLGRGKAISTTENEPVYLATSTQDLKDAFNTIVNGVRSCSIELNGSVQAGFEDKGSVTIDGNDIVKDDPNGYVLSGNTLEFVGTSCDLIKSGDRSIDIQFPCGGFRPVVK